MRSILRTIILAAAVGLGLVFSTTGRPQESESDAAPGGLARPDESQPIEGFRVKTEHLHDEFADPTQGFTPRRYRYIVQDPNGNVIGHMQVSIEPAAAGERYLIMLKKSYDFAGEAVLTLTAEAETLDPQEVEIKFAGGLSSTNETAPVLTSPPDEDASADDAGLDSNRGEEIVHYYYDTVSVSIRRPGATTLFTFRRLLPSYDLEELFLLMNVLDVRAIPAHSIWYLTAPFERATYAVLVERQGDEVVYGADAEKHLAIRLRLTSQPFCEDYFVESLPPHRLVKFTAGDLTFTLWEDTSERATPVPGGAM